MGRFYWPFSLINWWNRPYEVDPATGTVGHIVKALSSGSKLFTKTTYDTGSLGTNYDVPGLPSKLPSHDNAIRKSQPDC